MAPSVTLRRVDLVRTEVSKEISTFIIRVKRIAELGTIPDNGSAKFLRNVGP
jgi:hypothetical protein